MDKLVSYCEQYHIAVINKSCSFDVASSACNDNVDAKTCCNENNADASDAAIASYSRLMSGSTSETVTRASRPTSDGGGENCQQIVVNDVVTDDYTILTAHTNADATYKSLVSSNDDYVSVSARNKVAEASNSYTCMLSGVTSDDYSHPLSACADLKESTFKRLAINGDVTSSDYVRPIASDSVSTTDTVYRCLVPGDDVISADYSHPFTVNIGVNESKGGYNCLASNGDANKIEVQCLGERKNSFINAQQFMDEVHHASAEHAGALNNRGQARMFTVTVH
jgi:hypothetical protein